MLELISVIILFIGLIGMGVIVFRKIPTLVELPTQAVRGPGFLTRFKNKIKSSNVSRSFSGEILLQKILSKIRILTLKTENKTGTWLVKLRHKTLEKKNKFSEDYWKKLRKKR